MNSGTATTESNNGDSQWKGGYRAYLAFQSASGESTEYVTLVKDESTIVEVTASNETADEEAVDDLHLPTTTLGCLVRYGQSNNVSERQVAVRHVLKALQSLNSSQQDDIEQVFGIVRDRFAEDPDPLIRAEMVEQLPMLCMNCQQTPALVSQIDSVLIPLLAKFLDDINAQVRKTCQAAIGILLDQENLLSQEAVESLICPALLSLANPLGDRSDDVRLEAISLLCKIVTSSSVSVDWTYNVFLGKFTNFLQDSIFHIRKCCASNLGDISGMVGRQLTEEMVVPHLLTLSQDSVWGVRKACAEVYTEVSKNSCMTVRRNQLAPRFITLLADPSRWVSGAAFQTLGPFIATFANSNRTGLVIRDGTVEYLSTSNADDGRTCAGVDEPLDEKETVRLPPGAVLPEITRISSVNNTTADSNEHEQATDLGHLLNDYMEEDKGATWLTSVENIAVTLNSMDIEWQSGQWNQEEEEEEEGLDEHFSAFNFWHKQTDIQLMPLEQEESGVSHDMDRFMQRHFDRDPVAVSATHSDIDCNSVLSSWQDSTRRLSDDHLRFNLSSSPQKLSAFDYQEIIPEALLDNFISMVEPSRAQLIETDISRHCAHNFPAVAYTLGRKHWPRLRHTYTTLATDMQWRVRQTLAYSMHEMAAIVGEDLTGEDLLPVFRGFLRDLDEVRIGVLKHLYDFFKLLNAEVRKSLLPTLADFMQTDNQKNWRFRYEFTKQCVLLCDLYDIDDINNYLAAIGLTLATDRIADIRKEATVLLTAILSRFIGTEEGNINMQITRSFVDDIVKGFAMSVRWLRRQTYANFCEKILNARVMREELFVELLFEHFLALSFDNIPNVRICFIRAVETAYFKDEHLVKRVDEALKALSRDKDENCRSMAKQVLIGRQLDDDAQLLHTDNCIITIEPLTEHSH